MGHIYFSLAANGLLEFIEFVVFLLGVGIVGLVFWIGLLIAAFVRGFTSSMTKLVPLYMNRRLVDCLIKGVLVIVALIMGNAFHLKFADVIGSAVPIGDFNSIAEEFAANPDKWGINVFFNTMMNQMFLSFAYFIPFFGVDLVAGIVEAIICEEENPPGILDAIIAFVMDAAVILSVNAIVMCSGMTFPRIMYQFLQEIRMDFGIIRWLLLLVAFVLMFYFVVKDLFSADILLAIFGVNTAAMFYDINVTDANRWMLFGVAILLGLLSKIVRKKLLPGEQESNDLANVIFGVIVLVFTCVAAFGALWLINQYAPGFSASTGLAQ